MQRDRQATTHGVDLFFAVNLHHLHLHLLWVVFETLTHFHNFWIDGFHLGHALVSVGIQPIESGFEQDHQADDGPTPVTQNVVELVQQPEQGLGQNGQPTIVFDQLQAWIKRFEFFLFLWAGIESSGNALRLAWLDHFQRRDRRYAIAAVGHGRADVHCINRDVAIHAIRQDPRTRKVMLHHGDVAGVGLFFNIHFFLLDVCKLDLLVFLGFCVNRRACEGRIKR